MGGWPVGSDPAISGDGGGGDPGAAVPDDARYDGAHLVGAGGMGRVERVFDRHLGREVARKTLIRAHPTLARRLLREARLTARLDHPGIVPIFDLHEGDGGLPWYTMRLIRGEALQTAIDRAQGLDERLRLVPRLLAASQAVAHAHDRGVVHRDLKPANIMIGPHGDTLVVDWGLGRSVESGAAEDDDIGDAPVGEGSGPLPSHEGPLTRIGAVVGTPDWMSPEQGRGEMATRRSDVWALGRILLLLVGGPAATVARRPADAAGSGGPAELRAIIDKACATDPGARYADASAFAADLEAWLEGRLVEAHDYTPIEHLRRFVRSFRVPIAVGVAALLVLGTGLSFAFVRVASERDRATEAESGLRAVLARERARSARAALVAMDPFGAREAALDGLRLGDQPEAVAVLGAALAGGPRVGAVRTLDTCAQPHLGLGGARWLCGGADGWSLRREGEASAPLPQLAGAEDVVLVDDGVIFSVGGVIGRLREGEVWGPAHCVVTRPGLLRPDPGAVIVHGDQLFIRRWDATGRMHEHRCPGEEAALAYTATGAGGWAAICSAGTLLLGMDASVVVEQGPLPPGTRGSAIAELPSGAFVVGTLDGELWVVDPRDGPAVGPAGVSDAPLRGLEPAPGGALVVAVPDTGPARLVHVATGVVVESFPASWRQFRWVDDGTLRVGGSDGVFEVALDGPVRVPVVRAPGGAGAIDVDPRSGRLAIATGPGVAILADADGVVTHRNALWPQVLKDIEFAPHDAVILSGGAGPGSAFWLRADGGLLGPAQSPDASARRQPLFDGGFLSAVYAPRVERIAPDGAVTRVMDQAALHLDGDDAGRTVLVVGRSPWLSIFEAEDGSLRTLRADGAGPATLMADGTRVLYSTDGRFGVLDSRSGDLLSEGPLAGEITALALAPERPWLAAGTLDGSIRVLEWTTGEVIAESRVHGGRISDLRLRGGVLRSASWDGTVRTWDIDAALELRDGQGGASVEASAPGTSYGSGSTHEAPRDRPTGSAAPLDPVLDNGHSRP